MPETYNNNVVKNQLPLKKKEIFDKMSKQEVQYKIKISKDTKWSEGNILRGVNVYLAKDELLALYHLTSLKHGMTEADRYAQAEKARYVLRSIAKQALMPEDKGINEEELLNRF